MPPRRSARITGLPSFAVIATSPATWARPFVPVKAAQVLSPILAVISAGAFGLTVKGVVRIGPIDDPAQQNQCRIAGQVVFLKNRLKGTFFRLMPKLHVGYIKRDAPFPGGFTDDLVGGNEEKFCLPVDEFFDQPGTGDPVNHYAFASNPFHMLSSPAKRPFYRPPFS
jgi:hypothetical protein